MASHLIADSFVTLAAIAGLLILHGGLTPSSGAGWINNRYKLVISVLIAMMAGRVLFWLSGWEVFQIITLIAAALIPLAMLLLCEGLMRRHSIWLFKYWTVGGAVVFSLMAPIGAFSDTIVGSIALLGFQFISFVSIGIWVVRRDRTLLSTSENRVIDRLAWSLVFIVPFAISDFRIGYLDSPVRLSAIAILILCWLSLSLNRARADSMQILGSLLMAFLGCAVVTFAISLIAGLDLQQMIQVGAMLLCTGAVLQIRAEATGLRRDETRYDLLAHVIDFEGRDSEQFLRALSNHELFDDALILHEEEMGDFDQAFRDHLRRQRVVIADSGIDRQNVGLAEQLNWFFDKYAATHVIHISDSPFRLLAINIPSITNDRDAELELAVVQKFASMIQAGAAS